MELEVECSECSSSLCIVYCHASKYNNGSSIILSVEPCTNCIDTTVAKSIDEVKEPLLCKIAGLKGEIEDMDIRNI
jgi:hypothetical protein